MNTNREIERSLIYKAKGLNRNPNNDDDKVKIDKKNLKPKRYAIFQKQKQVLFLIKWETTATVFLSLSICAFNDFALIKKKYDLVSNEMD